MPRPRFLKLVPEKRQRILEAAALEFASRGFERASLNRIISAAGISKGAAYYYFDDKADLFATVVLHGSRMLAPDTDVDISLLDADAFWPVLLGLYAEMLQKAREQPWLAAVGKLVYGAPPSTDVGGLVAEPFARVHRWLGALIARGQAVGVIRADVHGPLLLAMAAAAAEAADRWIVDDAARRGRPTRRRRWRSRSSTCSSASWSRAERGARDDARGVRVGLAFEPNRRLFARGDCALDHLREAIVTLRVVLQTRELVDHRLDVLEPVQQGGGGAAQGLFDRSVVEDGHDGCSLRATRCAEVIPAERRGKSDTTSILRFASKSPGRRTERPARATGLSAAPPGLSGPPRRERFPGGPPRHIISRAIPLSIRDEVAPMSETGLLKLALGGAFVAALAAAAPTALAQNDVKPVNDLPNPYRTIADHFKMPDGRQWGSTSAVAVAPDGKTLWIAERCGANSCLERPDGRSDSRVRCVGHAAEELRRAGC